MYINHTRLQLIYGAFYRPDFYKHSLTKHSAENLFQNKRPSRSDARPYFWITQTSFQSFKRENQELGQQFKKLGRVFVLQHSPCCPSQTRLLYSDSI